MTNTICTFRMDESKRKRIENIAEQNGTTPSEIIRERLNEFLIYNGSYREAVQKIVNNLRGSFQFIRTQKGMAEAKKERELRNTIADELEKRFGLEADNEDKNTQ